MTSPEPVCQALGVVRVAPGTKGGVDGVGRLERRVRLSLIGKEGGRTGGRLSVKLRFHRHITFPDGASFAVRLRLPVPFIVAIAIGVCSSLEFAAWVESTIAESRCDGQSRAGSRLNAHSGMRAAAKHVKSTCETIVTSEIERERSCLFGCCAQIRYLATSWSGVWPTSCEEKQKTTAEESQCRNVRSVVLPHLVFSLHYHRGLFKTGSLFIF
jgi:hypothetical protein